MFKFLQIKTIGTILLWGILVFLQGGLSAQSGDPKISREKWENIAKKYDYSKEKELKQQEKKAEDEKIKGGQIETPKKNEPILSPTAQEILKYTLFGVVILLLAFIGYKLIMGGNLWNNRKIEKPKVYTLENLEENLDKVNLSSFLDDALNQNNYRLAIRLMFLNIIKNLSNNGQIVWKKDKTNGDYLLEMKKNSLYTDFKNCTLAYEFIWFNEQQEFNAADFNSIRPDFEKFLSETLSAAESKKL